jgi:hypothetical protein
MVPAGSLAGDTCHYSFRDIDVSPGWVEGCFLGLSKFEPINESSAVPTPSEGSLSLRLLC